LPHREPKAPRVRQVHKGQRGQPVQLGQSVRKVLKDLPVQQAPKDHKDRPVQRDRLDRRD
jgi:hypothetical protein